MPKRTLTEKEIAELQKRRHESLMSTPVFRNIAGTARNINMQPQNTAAIAQLIQNNPKLNPGLLSPINESGLIDNANAGSSTPVIQPSMQTNPQTPTQQPSNIFGDAMTTIFPGINQDNKQLINAAILRGSLELLKPRQPSEGLAGQFGRAIDAGQKVGTDLQKQGLENLVAQFGIQKDAAQIKKLQKEVGESKPTTPTKEQSRIFKNSIDSLIDIDKDFATDINTIQKNAGDWGGLEDKTKDLLSLAAIEIGGNPTEALKKAAKRLATGQLSINNQNQASTQTGVDQDSDITEN